MPTLTINDWARVMAVLKTNGSHRLFVGFLVYPSLVVGSDVLKSINLNSSPIFQKYMHEGSFIHVYVWGESCLSLIIIVKPDQSLDFQKLM